MRRVGIIFMAGAALVLALVVPTVASATGKSTTSQQSAEISAQSIGLDDEITAQGKKGGKHAKHGKGRHGRHGKGDGYRHGRSRHGHHRHHYGHRGGYDRHYYGHRGGYNRHYYGHPYYGGGYYGGGYGCNYDYPCGGGQTYDCTRYRGPDGNQTGDPHCRYDARCDCWYHTSDRTPQGSQTQPAPDQSGQPAPDQGQAPPPQQDTAPAPDQGSNQPY